MNIFYVYEHWRPDKNVCFWVGKGKGKRAYDFKRNDHYNKIVAKLARLGLCVEVRIVRGGLSEDMAHRLEIKRIQYWKLRHGELANITDGGEGTSGMVHPVSVRSKIGNRVREAWKRPEVMARHLETHVGRKHSPEHRRKIGDAHRGKKRPESAVEKTRLALKGRPQPAGLAEKVSVTLTKMWTDPDYRQRMVEAHQGYEPTDEPRSLELCAW